MTAHDATLPDRVGLVLHQPIRYDLRLWFTTSGREGRFRRELLDRAGVAAGESVLDVGCGTGSLAIAAAKRVGRAGTVRAIDPSPEMIRWARRKARLTRADVDFSEGLAQQLPFQDASFDVVLATFVLHQLPGEQLDSIFDEMRRVLRPAGRLLLVDIGGAQGDRQTVHVQAAAQHGVHLFDLEAIGPLLPHVGLRELAGGEIDFRLRRFERTRWLLATPLGPAA